MKQKSTYVCVYIISLIMLLISSLGYVAIFCIYIRLAYISMKTEGFS